MGQMDVLAEAVRRSGARAGLEVVGIAAAAEFSDTREVLERRKAQGLSAGMQFTYRNPARSTDPARTLPGAKSLVVGALSYLHAPPERPASPEHAGRPEHTAPPLLGDVARYSRVDYYGQLRRALEVVADTLRAEGWATVVIVDDNALVDRAAAYRAGLGWWGKNTNILLPSAGSWFLLGSVVTDAPLPPGQPMEDSCGRCSKCQTACPTGALAEAGALDARRCLAWLLQAPGVFPRRYRASLGARLYGCDDCQEACPVNRAASRRSPPPAAEESSQAYVDVLALLAQSDEELLASFGRWYIPQRQPRYLRRNALIVLGNVGDPSDVRVASAIRAALEDSDPLLRAHAVWAAGRLGLWHLLSVKKTDPDPVVRAELDALEVADQCPLGVADQCLLGVADQCPLGVAGQQPLGDRTTGSVGTADLGHLAIPE